MSTSTRVAPSSSSRKVPDVERSFEEVKNRLTVNHFEELKECCVHYLRSKLTMGSVPSVVKVESINSAKKSGLLILTNQSMSSIPHKIFTVCERIRLLDLSGNCLLSIPPDIRNFRTLKSLFLNANQLTELPEEIGLLLHLESFSVSYNFLISLPGSLRKLIRLREFKASMNKLDQFPEQLLDLVHLNFVDLSHNRIQVLNDSVGLDRLAAVDVNLNENYLYRISEDLAASPRLRTLRLQNNRLTISSIPDKLLSDSQISLLLLEGNKFEMRDIQLKNGYENYVQRHCNFFRKYSYESSHQLQ